MKGIIFPVVAFLITLILSLDFDLTTSVRPGWHTNITPAPIIWGVVTAIMLLLGSIGYWLHTKGIDKFSKLLFALHFFLTIATVIFIKFPTIFMEMNVPYGADFFGKLMSRMKLVPIAWSLFAAAQFLFPVYFIKAIRYNQWSNLRKVSG